MDNLTSKDKIKRAFIDLLETDHIEKISISKIIEKADVSRKTYYRYYYDQREILEDVVSDFINKLRNSNSLIGPPDIYNESSLQYTLNVYMQLKCYYENAELLRKLFKSSDAAEYLRLKIYDYLLDSFEQWTAFSSALNSRTLDPTQEDIEFYKIYSFAGLYDIIRGWIIGGCKTPIDVLVKFIVKQSASNALIFSEIVVDQPEN